ncbi:MAG: hypothetical protein ACAI35_14600 [Candidatus Methylacidiphilales bacterium]
MNPDPDQPDQPVDSVPESTEPQEVANESVPWIAPWAEPWIITLVYVVSLAVMMFRHDMWRDEFQAWAIASQSPTLSDLWYNLQFEGHPALWHVLLWICHQLGGPLQSMQVLHLLIGAGVVWIFARWAPFGFWHRMLFALGYFPLYEYGMISRNYSIGILLLFIGCVLLTRREGHTKSLLTGVVIFLLFQTSAFGAILALALCVWLVTDNVLQVKSLQEPSASYTQLLAPLFMAGAGFALFFLQIYLRRTDNGALGPAPGVSDRIIIALSNLPRALFPNPQVFTKPWYDKWNSTWVTDVISIDQGKLFVSPALFLIIMVITCAYLWNRRRALMFFLAGIGGMLLFTYFFVMADTIRYAGSCFFIWIVAVWFAKSEQPVQPDPEPDAAPNQGLLAEAWHFLRTGQGLQITVTASLIASCVATLQLSQVEATVPFSQSGTLAQWLREEPQSKLKTVVYPEYIGTPIAVLNGKPFYSLARQGDAVFSIWKPENIWIPKEELYKRLNALLVKEAPKEIVYISNVPLPPPEGEHLRPYFTFAPSIARESFFVYILRKSSPADEGIQSASQD